MPLAINPQYFRAEIGTLAMKRTVISANCAANRVNLAEILPYVGIFLYLCRPNV